MEKIKKKTFTPLSGFPKYRRAVWKRFSGKAEKVTECNAEIKRSWDRMTEKDQEKYSLKSTGEKVYCIFQKKYTEDDQRMMVAFDICDNWFHIECINIEPQMGIKADFYHCKGCIQHRYRAFLAFLKHFSMIGVNTSKWEIIGKIFSSFLSKPQGTKAAH